MIWIALAAVGVIPQEAISRLIEGSMGSERAWTGTLRNMAPLLLAGTGVFIAFKAGLFNIGAEGQMVMGGLASVAVLLAMPNPAGLGLSIVAGIAAGAVWALPAGLIKAYRGGHEVITTIMLNAIAVAISGWLLHGALRNPEQESATTEVIDQAAQLPSAIEIPPLRISWAVVLAIGLALAVWWWMRRTTSGFELRAAGENPIAAKFAGVPTERVTVWAMAVSGAFSGLGGALLVSADQHRFYEGITSGYGFDALGVALLAGGASLLLLPSALLFAVIAKGTASLSILGVPKPISSLLLGLIIIVFAAYRYRKEPQGRD